MKVSAAADPPTNAPARDALDLLARPGIVCLLLALVTVAAFWPVRDCDFISLDDTEYVTTNPHVQQGLTPANVAWAFSMGYGANWHPLTWLSHMLDVQLFGLNPAGPHLVNLLLHAANTVLLFLVLRQLTGAHRRSAFVAALFALHPLHVESVAWISERKDVLSTLFLLLTIWAYARHATSGRRVSPFYLLALLCFTLGLLAKPMLVTLPCVLLLLDFWPLKRFPGFRFKVPGFLLLEKIPFFALAAISCALTLLAQSKAVQTWTEFSLATRIENAFVSYARYLGKLFWPVNLALPYPHPGQWPWPLVLASVALVVVASAAALRFARRAPFAFTGWFWFAGTLVPVIGLVQVGIQSLADRYTYVPSIGLFIAVVWLAAEMFARRRAAAAVLAVVILGACALRTRDQLQYWRNSETLFRRAIAVTPENVLAHFSLGYALGQKGDLDGAIDQYQQALRIRGDSFDLLENLGNAYANRRQFTDAIAAYQAALRLDATSARVHSNLGAVLDALGNTGDAMREFNEALRLAPDDGPTHFRLANILVKLGRNDEAIEQYRAAVRQAPDLIDARNNLGVALFNARRIDEAIEQFTAVVRAQPENISARLNLGNALGLQRRWDEAVAQYREAVRLAPSADTHFALGFALARLGRRDDAVAELTEVLRIKPDHAPAKQLLESLGTAK